MSLPVTVSCIRLFACRLMSMLQNAVHVPLSVDGEKLHFVFNMII